MKFLCPSCKAKYQIADEKVAGKSVRMKCRKCGFMIHVSKLAEATAHDDAAPATDTPAPPSSRPAVVSPPSPGAPKAVARPSAPRAAPPPRRGPPPRREASAPLRSSPVATPAPRPTPTPATAAPPPAAPPHAPDRAPPAGRIAYQDDDERTVIAGAGALAGAFAAAVGAAPVSTALEDLASAADDWYVGINGVPVGPIRLSELRSKAASGAVTAESLVWRDGFEEWLPLKTFPELVAIVEEGASSAYASLAPPDSLSAAPTARGDALGASPVGHMSDPFKLGAVAPVTGPAVVTEKQAGDFDIDAIVPPKRGTSPAAWIAVIVALLFGLTIGFVMFNKDKQVQQIVKYVQVPASAAAQPVAGGPKETPEAEKDPKTGTPATHGQKIAKGGPAPKNGDPQPTKTSGLSGLQGLSGLAAGTGPKGPSGDVGSSASSGEPLDGAKVQATVARYTSSVRRSCWQPALDTRDKDAPTSARVSVAIRVSPSGSVQSASTSGDPKGYRGLAGCIGSKVRSWQFPASSGTTTVNVPFVFAAQ